MLRLYGYYVGGVAALGVLALLVRELRQRRDLTRALEALRRDHAELDRRLKSVEARTSQP